MKARDLTIGTRIRANGRTWTITLIHPHEDDLKIYLDADDGDMHRIYDTSDLYAKPEAEVEVVATVVRLECPICLHGQIEATDPVVTVTAPTLEEAREELVTHILSRESYPHDEASVVEYLVKELAR